MGNYLVHYGVLGMKWGRRKSRANKSSQSSPKRSMTTSSAKKKAKKKVKIKELSDAELQKKINRLQMEKRYRDLKRDEVSVGRQMAGEILRKVGTNAGYQVGMYATAKVVNSVMKDNVIQTNQKKEKKDKKDAA